MKEGINYKDSLRFWNQRARKTNGLSNLSITLFNDDPVEVKRRHNIEIKVLFDNIDFLKAQMILDLGCGIGRFTLPLAKRAKFVVGVDFSQPLLHIAIRNAKDSHISNVDFICSSADTFRYRKKFELIIVSALFIYLNDAEILGTIKNIFKHLSKGGEVLVRESIGLKKKIEIIDQYSSELKANYNAIYRTVDTISDLFKQEGFRELVSKKLYQHRKDTATWLFKFKKYE